MIKKGDQIVCANGHVIADVLENIDAGTMAWGRYIGNWRQSDVPIMGFKHKPVCAVCGAPFFKGDGWYFHLKSERAAP